MLSVIAVPATAYLILQNNRVQNFVAQKLTRSLSQIFETEVVVKSVSFDVFNQLVIDSVLIKDKKNDTLLFSQKLTLSLGNFSIANKRIHINKLELYNADIQFYIDSARTVNLEFIIRKIAGDTTSTEKGFAVSFGSIGIVDSKFRLEDAYKSVHDKGIDFSYMQLSELNIKVRNLKAADGAVAFKINKLRFREKSGFIVDNLSARMSLRKNMMHFDNLTILTPRSKIIAPRIYFDFPHFNQFKDFAQKVNIQFQFDESLPSFADIAFFAPALWGVGEKFSLSGFAKGKLSDLRCRQIKFKTARNTSFTGNVSLTGLPNFGETYMFIEAKKLTLSPEDVESFYIPVLPSKRIVLPEMAKKAGNITFKGNFTGFVNDFVTYGTFTTQLGTIKSDLSLKPTSKSKIAFKGQLTALNFKAGKFLGKEQLIGNANIKLIANGYIIDNKKVTGVFDGTIDDFQFKGYTYSQIKAKGSLNENVFDGAVSLDDPNLNLDVLGRFNFSKANPEFDFSAYLHYSDLVKLNLVQKDSVFKLSTYMVTKLKGDKFENADGEITFTNAKIIRNDKFLNINEMTLNSKFLGQSRKLTVNSDFFDVQIIGKNNWILLQQDVIKLIKTYLPSSFYSVPINAGFSENHFEFSVNFKDTKPLLGLFYPSIDLAANSRLAGAFFSSDSVIRLSFYSPLLKINSNKFSNFNFTANSNPDSMWISCRTSQFVSGSNLKLNAFSFNTKLLKDSTFSNAFWTNTDSLKTKSYITAYTGFSENEPNKRSVMNLTILPAQFYLLDSMWSLDYCTLHFDSSAISSSKFIVKQGNQSFSIAGKISENPLDTMNVSFSDFNLMHLKYFLKNKNVLFDGSIRGQFSINDFYHKSTFEASLVSDKMALNGEVIGKTNVLMKWNPSSKMIDIKVVGTKDDYTSLNLTGTFTPSNKEFDFKIKTQKIGLILFQPFVQSLFLLHKGKCTGDLTLTGTVDYPLLNGDIKVEDGRFTVLLLKTNYKFDTEFSIRNNNFILSNIKVYDRDKNLCVVNGTVFNKYFRELSLDLNISADKAMVLNTFSTDNQPFYGKAYASGVVDIKGSPPNIAINISHGRTEKNSVVYLPLNRKVDLVESNFISFKNVSKTAIKKDTADQVSVYEVNTGGISLNFDLEVTPDAEIQLLFDQKIGNILRSTGSGNLKLALTNSNFTINGDYTVTEGDYLFTLENLVNKKFTLQPGGTINFNGNPLDANLDLIAYHRAKAPLYNLYPGSTNEEYKQRIAIDCRLLIAGKLLNPDIKYDIVLPNSSEETRNKLRQRITNEGDLSKQFVMLLVTNNFYADPSTPNPTGANLAQNMASTASAELLSNQVNNWISQISKDVDIGFNYRPGDDVITNNEVELALSTQLLNDRISINGNLDMSGSNQSSKINPKANTNGLVGDVNVEFKLTERMRLKAFNRANDQLLLDQAPYTQGVGIMYREEFANLSELRRRYYQLLFAPKKKEDKK